jgi:phage shock protein A
MEDTLVEIKAGTAQAMANLAHLRRRRDEVAQTHGLWLSRAKQAVEKNRDDLARTALIEKRRAETELAAIDSQIAELDGIVAKHHDEIDQLEAKIAQARDREKILAMRQTQAEQSIKASGQMKRYDLATAQAKLQRLDQRLDHIEAEAELEKAHRGRAQKSLDSEFAALDDAIEKELASLKS